MKKITILLITLLLAFLLVGCKELTGEKPSESNNQTNTGENSQTGDNTGEGENGQAGDNTGEGENGQAGNNTGEGENGQTGDNTGEGENGQTGEDTGEGESGQAGEDTGEGENGQTGEDTGEGENGQTGDDTPVVFTVKFDSDGGTNIVDQEIEEDGKITKPDDPEKESYSFDGWLYNDIAWDFENDTVSSDMTLVAKWVLLPLYEAGITNTIEQVTIDVGDELVLYEGISAIDSYGNDVTDLIQIEHQIEFDDNGCVTSAGDYVVKYTVVIDNKEYTATRNIIINEVIVDTTPTEYIISFDDGTVTKQYENSKWTQEVFYSNWQATSGQMNCREKNGVKVVNFTSGYNTTFRYTYRDGELLCKANNITFKAGNYYSPNQPIPIKIIVIDEEGESHYVVGDENSFYTFNPTDGLVDQQLIFNEVKVTAFVIVCKGGAQAYQYLYLSNITLGYDKDLVIPDDNGGNNNPGGESGDNQDDGRLNLLADLPASGSDYVSEYWTCEQYSSGWRKVDTVQMRSRTRSNITVTNFATVTVPSRYTYSKGGASLGTFNKISFKFANDWNPTDEICIIMLLTDMNGKEIYLFGSGSGYDKIPVQSLTAYEFEFETTEIKDVQIMIMLIQSSVSSSYLYMGDAYLSLEE